MEDASTEEELQELIARYQREGWVVERVTPPNNAGVRTRHTLNLATKGKPIDPSDVYGYSR